MKCAAWALRDVLRVARSPRLAEMVAVSATCSSHGVNALRTLRRAMHRRGEDPDDPFHERRGWEDGVSGPYAMLSRVDQDAIAAASLREEVSQTHFGPLWARAPTLVQGAAQWRQRSRDRTRRTQRDGPSSSGNGSNDSGGRSGGGADEIGLSAEEMHQRVLDSRKRAMQRNYGSYIDFLEAEVGGGEARGPPAADATRRTTTRGDTEEAATPPLDAQRAEEGGGASCSEEGASRAAEDATEENSSDDDGPSEPLPHFMQSPFSMALPEATAPVSPPSARPCGRGRAKGEERAVPAWLTRRVLHALGPAHGNAAIALVDPEYWDTDTVLLFLRGFDPTARASAAGVMDESMCDAFRLAAVDGRSLLQVTPPHLFRVLRRWHVRRQEVVQRAWRTVQQTADTSRTAGEPVVDAAVLEDVVARGLPRLQETIAALTPELIQETILLSFHFGR